MNPVKLDCVFAPASADSVPDVPVVHVAAMRDKCGFRFPSADDFVMPRPRLHLRVVDDPDRFVVDFAVCCD